MANFDFSHVDIKKHEPEMICKQSTLSGIVQIMSDHLEDFKSHKDWWIKNFGEDDYNKRVADYEASIKQAMEEF